MIRLIAFAAFALALATSAQAMPRVPLHQPDGMTTQVRYYGYRHYGYRHHGYRPYGYGPTATAIGPTATAIGTTATAIGPTAIGHTVMESPVELPAAISGEEFSDSETPTREGSQWRMK